MLPKKLILVGIISVLVCGSLVVSATSIRDLLGTFGNTHVLWLFRSDDNAGTISLGINPGAWYSKVQLVDTSLQWYFWMQTTGWAHFYNASIAPSGGNIRDLWNVSGFAWSENAGWIDFSTVKYDPNTLSFLWFAWSNALWWIPFGVDGVGSTPELTQVGNGFIGKVKIIGNIGSDRIYDVLYGVGDRYKWVSMAEYTNVVRKNVALLTRNLNTSQMNTDFTTTFPKKVNNFSYYTNSETTAKTLVYSTIAPTVASSDTKSIITVGADIYIDTDVLFTSNLIPRAIIALKNESGAGGNIYIKGDVRKIRASLFIEGSLYSGFMNASGIMELYNSNATVAATNLPDRQLYIVWSLISHNTIGGSSFSQMEVTCPYGVAVCTYDTALRYDLNYFRDFQTKTPTQRAYPTTTFDDYSVIIEYDPKILSDPPPGLSF